MKSKLKKNHEEQSMADQILKDKIEKKKFNPPNPRSGSWGYDNPVESKLK
jgi:hypothetical protein